MNYFKLLKELAALKHNEKMTVAQLQSLQEKKLRTMLAFAYDHSDYYRKSFQQAGITAETLSTAPLAVFPTIDKQLATLPGSHVPHLRGQLLRCQRIPGAWRGDRPHGGDAAV